MAEEIKQLVNQNFTGANLTNNNQFTLINNNSSTTSVVREVFVTGSDIAADKAKLFITYKGHSSSYDLTIQRLGQDD